MSTYRLIDYFDVWHNEEEGYFVNDQCIVEEGIVIAEDATNEDIFNYLKNTIGYLGPETKFENFNFDGDDFFIELSTELNGEWYPICRLQKEI